jgi:hypothetical protein
VYRGILQSNGDVGLDGRKGEDRVNMTANNHGSIECVDGRWYVFYHRHTHNSTYSRQACAEPISIETDGSIKQAECTSCGLNGGPLTAEGKYPAAIACNITNGAMPHVTNRIVNAAIPYVTHNGDDRYITNIKDGTQIVYKYFDFLGPVELSITLRGTGSGRLTVSTNEFIQGFIPVQPAEEWYQRSIKLDALGKAALKLEYQGDESVDLISVDFNKT